MNPNDELVSLIMQIAQSQIGDVRAHVWGYISAYDPVRHMVTCVIPAFRNQDDTPVLSPWMQLGSGFVGNGYGIQVAPHGGATLEKPTAGEQVIVKLVERDNGVAVAAQMLFSDSALAPFPTILAGEIGIKHQSGTTLYFHEDGSLTASDVEGGTIKLDGHGGIRVTDSTEAFYELKAGVFTLKCDTVSADIANGLLVKATDITLTNHDPGAIIEEVKLASGAASSVVSAAR